MAQTRVLVAAGELPIVRLVTDVLTKAGCLVIGVVRITAVPQGSKKLRVRVPNGDFSGTVPGELDMAEERFDVVFIDNNLGEPNGHVLVPLLRNAFAVGISAHPDDHEALFRAEPGVQVALLRPTDLLGALTGALPVQAYAWRDDFNVPEHGHLVLGSFYEQIGARKKP